MLGCFFCSTLAAHCIALAIASLEALYTQVPSTLLISYFDRLINAAPDPAASECDLFLHILLESRLEGHEQTGAALAPLVGIQAHRMSCNLPQNKLLTAKTFTRPQELFHVCVS